MDRVCLLHLLLSPLPFSLSHCQTREIMLRYRGLDPPSCPLPLSPSPLFCSSIQARDPQINGEAVSGSESLQTSLLTHTKRNNPHAALIHPPIHHAFPKDTIAQKIGGGGRLLACSPEERSNRQAPRTQHKPPTQSHRQNGLPACDLATEDNNHTTSIPHSIPNQIIPPTKQIPSLPQEASLTWACFFLFSQVYFHTLACLRARLENQGKKE